MPAIGGAPGSALAFPTMPVESTIVGEDGARDAQHVEHVIVPVAAVVEHETRDTDVRLVGDVERSLGQHPCDPRVDRAEAEVVAGALGVGHVEQEGELRRRLVRREPHPVGREHEAHPGGAEVLPADAGSDRCSPVVESQTIVDARWFAMPTASTGPPSASAAVATSSAAAPISAASNSTKPGDGERGSTSRWCTWSTVASGRTIAARTPLVPTSTTRMLTLWAPPRAAGVHRSSRRSCPRPSRAARSTGCATTRRPRSSRIDGAHRCPARART